jgi:hypothetical protein
MRPKNLGDRQPGERLRDGRCAVCGELLDQHPTFGDCYRRAMDGDHQRGRTGAETIKRS